MPKTFNLVIPDPKPFPEGKAMFRSVVAGTILHRIHPSKFHSTQFNNSNLGQARFSPLYNSGGEIVPTIYAAETFECAVCEIILRSPDTDSKYYGKDIHVVFPHDSKDRTHSTIELESDLNLVDLSVAGQRAIGIQRNALLAGPKSTYDNTQAWASAIYESCPSAQGFFYPSHQFGDKYALVIFETRFGENNFAKKIATRPVIDASCHSEIEALAAKLGIIYGEA